MQPRDSVHQETIRLVSRNLRFRNKMAVVDSTKQSSTVLTGGGTGVYGGDYIQTAMRRRNPIGNARPRDNRTGA
jgi:hypothetical protein